MFERGQLIADRFCLINPIGRGALGELWRAIDRVPDRQIAVRRVARFDEAATRRMLNEADAARAVRDRCVARVHRVGVLEDGAAYIASELLLSESLDELLSRRGRMAPGAALTLVADLARGVAVAHDRHLAHRAISPRTVLLHRDSSGGITPKLVDFGRVAVLDALTAYASPEQLTDDIGMGYESDVWALGVLLFRCVTGRVPFRNLGDTFEAERIIDAADLNAHVRSVVLSALDPVRSARATASQFADSAQIYSWRVSGGFRDLEKMVRIHAPVWHDSSATGTIDHFPTIPAFGVVPPPRSTEPPIELSDRPEEPEQPPVDAANNELFEQVGEDEIEEPAAPIAPPPLPRRIPEPVALPIAHYVTPIPDEVFVDFRPRKQRRAIIAACAGAAAVGIAAIASLASSPERHVRIGDVETRRATVAVAKPNAAPTTTAVAVAPSTPKHIVLAASKPTPTRARSSNGTESKSDTATKSYPIVGVPLWDPPKSAPPAKVAKPAKPVDDNPYN
jgi:serine/threonine protein kinase